MTRPGGIILCGGQSRRMGRPKAWLPFGPEVLLQRVVRLLGEAAGPIVLVAAQGQHLPELPESVVIVRDAIAERGPLQGLSAGLAALPEGVDLVYATATDTPFLCPAWIDRLVELIGMNDLAIPEMRGFLHPLAALYRVSIVLPAVQRLLAADLLRPIYLLDEVRALKVTADSMSEVDPELATLQNLNNPEDYQQALLKAGFETVSLSNHSIPDGGVPRDTDADKDRPFQRIRPRW